jgi:hypothetical protein
MGSNMLCASYSSILISLQIHLLSNPFILTESFIFVFPFLLRLSASLYCWKGYFFHHQKCLYSQPEMLVLLVLGDFVHYTSLVESMPSKDERNNLLFCVFFSPSFPKEVESIHCKRIINK